MVKLKKETAVKPIRIIRILLYTFDADLRFAFGQPVKIIRHSTFIICIHIECVCVRCVFVCSFLSLFVPIFLAWARASVGDFAFVSAFGLGRLTCRCV